MSLSMTTQQVETDTGTNRHLALSTGFLDQHTNFLADFGDLWSGNNLAQCPHLVDSKRRARAQQTTNINRFSQFHGRDSHIESAEGRGADSTSSAVPPAASRQYNDRSFSCNTPRTALGHHLQCSTTLPHHFRPDCHVPA